MTSVIKLMDSNGFIHSGGASSVILRTRDRAAHVASHMIVCCKYNEFYLQFFSYYCVKCI